jgi:tetratricopeptide (TPR) repeat protein
MRCFLSYRRDDTEPLAAEIFEHLSARFGNRSVFWDRMSIAADTDWEHIIRRDLEAADAVVALIGPKWLGILQERLDTKDYVRFELEYAHHCGKPVIVLPVAGASAPASDELPESLRYLARLQSPTYDFDRDSDKCRKELDQRILAFAPAIRGRVVDGLASQKTIWPWSSSIKPQLERHPSWWDGWNFHDPPLVSRVSAICQRKGPDPNILVLSGRHGSGRQYVAEASMRHARTHGSRLHYVRLDLDGYETTETDVLRRYLTYQANKRQISDPHSDRIYEWLEDELGTHTQTLDACATCGLLLDWSGSFPAVRRTIENTLRQTPVTTGARLLPAVLREIASSNPLALHVIDQATLPITLREDLLLTASQFPALSVVFSAFLDADSQDVAAGRHHVHCRIEALTKDAVRELLSQRLARQEPPHWLVDWLWRGCDGNRGQLAWLLFGLLQRSVLEWTNDDNWRFVDTPEAQEVLRESFAELVLAPIHRLYARQPALQRVLETAAICGQTVPLRLLCNHLKLDEQVADDVIGLVDGELCTSEVPVFEDLGSTHPAFPQSSGTPTYRFHSPLLPDMLLAAVTPTAREESAVQLLEFLESALPARTRGVAELYLSVYRHVPRQRDASRIWEQKLAWWIGVEDSERLRTHVTQRIDDGELLSETVWQTIQLTENAWPLTRRLALLEAYENQRDGIPVVHLSDFLLTKGDMLRKLARYEQAEPLLCRALDINEQSHGPNHPLVAIALGNLALLVKETNRLAEAEPLMRRALDINERSHGPDHPEVAAALGNLALLLKETNRLAEAEPLMRRALAIDEQSLGPDHPSVATRLNNLATSLKEMNRLAEAEPLMRRALGIYKQSFGPDHPSVATALNNLALLLQETSRLAEAKPLMRRALDIDERSFGPDHPTVATRLNNLAMLLKDMDRLAEAEPLMRRALAIHERSLGHDHPKVATALGNLALLLTETDRLAEAEPMMRRALAIDEQSLGPDHPSVGTELNNLALLLKDTNRPAEAEPMMRRALAIHEQSLGPDHPSVAFKLNNLALLLKDMNRPAEAEPMMRRALAIDEQAFGPSHPNVVPDLFVLARFLKDTNRLSEAEPLYRRMLKINEEAFGPSSTEVATHLRIFARWLQDAGRLADAESLYRRVLTINEEVFGPFSTEFAADLCIFARWLKDAGRLAEAEPLFRRALAIDETCHGPDHPKVGTRLNDLALLLRDMNRSAEAEPLYRRAVKIYRDHAVASGHEHRNTQVILENYLRLLDAMGLSEAEIAERLGDI